MAEAQRPASAVRGARLLHLLGRGDLRLDRVPEPAESGDAELVAAVRGGQDAALAVLIDRLTLCALQQGVELDQAEQRLRQSLDIARNDAPGERWLGERLEAVSERLWPLSRAWILPLEVLLAEAHDHRRLPSLEAAGGRLGRHALGWPPSFHHYGAKLYYRTGRYALALQEVALGLNRLGAEDPCERGRGLLGHLVSLLVDVDLPTPAAALHQRLDARIPRSLGTASNCVIAPHASRCVRDGSNGRRPSIGSSGPRACISAATDSANWLGCSTSSLGAIRWARPCL